MSEESIQLKLLEDALARKPHGEDTFPVHFRADDIWSLREIVLANGTKRVARYDALSVAIEGLAEKRPYHAVPITDRHEYEIIVYTKKGDF